MLHLSPLTRSVSNTSDAENVMDRGALWARKARSVATARRAVETLALGLAGDTHTHVVASREMGEL